MKNIFYTLILCFLINGCATTKTTIKLVPQVLNEQKIIDQEGSDAVISHKKTSAAVRPPSDAFLTEDRPMLYISVYGSRKPFDFSTQDIQVFVDGVPHRVFTYDDLVKEIDQYQEKKTQMLNSKFIAQSNKAADNAVKSSSDPEVFSPSDSSNIVGDTSKFGYKYDVDSIAQDHSRVETEIQVQKEAMLKQKQQAIR